MARRSDYTREELTEMAIVAGQKIMAERGFAQFSARQVAKEIGYTIGTLYNIFGSHTKLILCINAATLDGMHAFLVQKINPRQCGTDAIKNLASSYIQFAQENYNRWGALFEFSLPQDHAMPSWYEDKIKRLFALAEAPLLPLLRNDEIKMHMATKVLWAGIHGICQLRHTGTLSTIEIESAQMLTDSLIDNYMKGLVSQ